MATLLLLDRPSWWFVYATSPLAIGPQWVHLDEMLAAIVAGETAARAKELRGFVDLARRRAHEAMVDRTRWNGRAGERLCCATRVKGDSTMLAFAVVTAAGAAYVASPVPLRWPGLYEVEGNPDLEE